MGENLLVPSIEQRLAGLIEVNRRVRLADESSIVRSKRTITISREFGCEGYPAAEILKGILEKNSGEPWAIVDRTLVDEVARRHDIAADILHNLGKRPRWLDDMFSSLSTKWKNERDDFQLLARQIVAIAAGGNAIIVGMGGAIVTQSMKGCLHFRIFGSMEFKTASIARRAHVSKAEAVSMIEKRQRARVKFVRDFLDKDINDPNYYHVIFNNDKSSAAQIAQAMAAFLEGH